jgi:hypothetical protein
MTVLMSWAAAAARGARTVRRRDREAADAAVSVLLRKGEGAELRRGASATLAALGIDESSALAEARAAASGRAGVREPLMKVSASAVPITIAHESASGDRWVLEMTRAEAAAFADAALAALYGRR